MTTLSEAGLVGMVLFLVFAAVCYYLYMRITQVERKVSLLENILFDLKTATEHTLLSNEISHSPSMSYDLTSEEMSMPFEHSPQAPSTPSSQVKTIEIKEIQPYVEAEESPQEASEEAPSSPSVTKKVPTMTRNYESMNYIELKEIARSVKIKGFTHMTKKQLAEALRRFDAGEPQLKFDYGRGNESETVSLQNFKDLDQALESVSDVQLSDNNNAFL
jgi:hypothetical protein